MARKQFTIRCTDAQSIRWQSRMGGISCKTVEKFLICCADHMCKRLDVYYKRADRRMPHERGERG